MNDDIKSHVHSDSFLGALSSEVINKAPDGILLSDTHGTIIYANIRVHELFGYEDSEIIGNSVELLIPDRLKTRHVVSRTTYNSNPVVRPMKENGWLSAKRKDGSELSVQISLAPFEFKDNRYIICIIRDVSRLVQIEQNLLQSQKLEALGRLAGGIAHDFNNLLTVIAGFTEMVQTSPETGSKAQEMLGVVLKASNQAAEMTRQLLAFSRKQSICKKSININSLVQELAPMIKRLLDENINLTINLDPDAYEICGDPVQIERLIINLATNARDAMPNGGLLTILTSICKSPCSSSGAIPSHLPAGEYTVLTIADSGCGMDKVTKDRMFDPFFTTKDQGKGTGLGLSSVHGIVEQLCGFIEVDSSPNEGTRIVIFFPRLLEKIKKPRLTSHHSNNLSGRETLLLVEDDAHVLRFASTVLSTHGYKILEACDGPEALSVIGSYPGRIHALITDVVMPKMSGPALAKIVQEKQPDIKIVYISGHTIDKLASHNILESENRIVYKPYSPLALATVLRQVLDGYEIPKSPLPSFERSPELVTTY